MAYRRALLAMMLGLMTVQCKRENPIKHLIVLMMENRSFDHYLGWLKEQNPAIDGLTGTETNCVDASHECVTVSRGGYDTGPDDPDHSFDGTAEEIYGYRKPVGVFDTPRMDGFVRNAAEQGHDITNPMRMFTINNSSSHVLNTLAMEYAVFDSWFCSLPGPTDPNRGFAMSGTSNGMIDNFNGTLWSQQSYFDLLSKNDVSWAGYYYSTVWALGYFADLAVPPNSHNIHEFGKFYEDLQGDSLPSYIWLQPTGTSSVLWGPANWQHPDASVGLGEQLIESVYEALRRSPYWKDSALIITFDEHGGFYDHVPPPQTDIPPPDGVKASNGFTFDRLGVRIPTVAISPWINKGTVVHETAGPTNTSQYEGTSNMATANKLFGLTESDQFLGARHAWSATFDHIFMDRDIPRAMDEVPVFEEKRREWTMAELEAQRAKPVHDALESEVLLFCNHFELKPCPTFETQGQASDFILELMPSYIEKIKA